LLSWDVHIIVLNYEIIIIIIIIMMMMIISYSP